MTAPRIASALAVALCCTACYDFVEPDFPEAGAPALLQISASVFENGNVSISGLLAPGLTIAGVQRRVVNDTVAAYGVKLAPVAIRRNGSREYSFTSRIDDPDVLARPFDVQAPVIEDIVGPPPTVRWFGVRKVGPDTLTWQRGTDLVLRVESDLGESVPTPPIRQWFVDIRGNRSFRVSSDGFPPDALIIPSSWVPESDDGTLTVSLVFHQSGRVETGARDYIGLFSFSVQLRWVVHVIA